MGEGEKVRERKCSVGQRQGVMHGEMLTVGEGRKEVTTSVLLRPTEALMLSYSHQGIACVLSWEKNPALVVLPL